MAWWAPGSQSASRIGRGQVSARPTAKVVTPGEPPADVSSSIAISRSPARVAYQGDSILSGQHRDRWCGRRVDIDIDQDRRTVGSLALDQRRYRRKCSLPACRLVELSAAAGIAMRRTREDGSSRLPGARPCASFSPTIARPSAGIATSATAVETMAEPSTRSKAARLPTRSWS